MTVWKFVELVGFKKCTLIYMKADKLAGFLPLQVATLYIHLRFGLAPCTLHVRSILVFHHTPEIPRLKERHFVLNLGNGNC
jgi:hypothetical protein